MRHTNDKRKMMMLTCLMAVAMVLLASCSNKGVHMSKHRKSRKCNCPTFAYSYPSSVSQQDILISEYTYND